MSGETLTRTWGTLRLVSGRMIELGLNRRKAGLDFLEGKGYLFIVDGQAQPLGTRAMLRALQNLQDRREIGDPLVGAFLDRLQPDDLGPRCCKPALVFGLLTGHREDHRLERIDVIRQVGNG